MKPSPSVSAFLSLFAFAAVISLASIGCTPSGKVEVPGSYAKLPSAEGYSFRAANAKGVVVAVRTQDNELKGNIDFWAEAIDQHMRDDGYEGDPAIRDVQSRSGVAGKQIRYNRNQEGREYRYWLTIFLADSRVFVIEAGGDKEIFDPAIPEVESAVLSFRL